ncbi:MAG: VOC family protein [Myxococcales bacterium]|nr:VOC family protein [Myxococcales bacterium]
MTQPTGYSEGAPCWADLSTPDLQGAMRFYGPLLGWSFDEPVAEMGHYTMARVRGKMVAGLAPLMPEMGFPPAWSLYMWTDDADATAARVADAGGKLIMPVMDIPGAGRMMFAFDSTGAAFGAWQPGNHRGSELYDEPGALCWAEVNTRDGAATDLFYKRVFGYAEQKQIGDGKTFDYTVWQAGGEDVCGRMLMSSPEWPAEIPPHWMIYFDIADVDAACTRVAELGGKVCHGPFDSPHGRIAVINDPYGVTFSLIQRNAVAV